MDLRSPSGLALTPVRLPFGLRPLPDRAEHYEAPRVSAAIQRANPHHSRGSAVYARDLPRVQIDGHDIQHTLLLGHESLMSGGVVTHDLGLAGHLGRQLAQLTDRGQVVDVATAPSHALKAVTTALLAQPLWRFDSIVVCVDTAGPLPLFAGQHWQADAIELVGALDRACPVGTRAVIAATTTASGSRAAQLTGGLFQTARAIASTLKTECEQSANVDFVELPGGPAANLGDVTPALDHRWRAGLIADRLAETVTDLPESTNYRIAGSASDYRDRPQPEGERQDAVTALQLRDSLIHPHLRRILEVLKAAYGTRFAALNIVDGEAQWTMAVAGGELLDAARSESLCAVSIERDSPMIIPDAREDLHFQNYPSVVRGELRFYAGVPIESPTGLRIGALCILDPAPRTDFHIDPVLLTSAAHQVEKLIWEHQKSL